MCVCDRCAASQRAHRMTSTRPRAEPSQVCTYANINCRHSMQHANAHQPAGRILIFCPVFARNGFACLHTICLRHSGSVLKTVFASIFMQCDRCAGRAPVVQILAARKFRITHHYGDYPACRCMPVASRRFPSQSGDIPVRFGGRPSGVRPRRACVKHGWHSMPMRSHVSSQPASGPVTDEAPQCGRMVRKNTGTSGEVGRVQAK